ncbi:MAG TPA: non-canonical purine NTP pyrophosphatase [Gaiellaceae bacterium]|nr:non-canonical purine NTP pyrophosphatase [Gaiellaceae bacterium]
MNLRLASRNGNKLRELRLALPGWEIELLDAPDEAVEDGPSFLANARIKANHGRRFAPRGTWVVGEDSGIEVEALGGHPGIQSARWAEDGVERLLRELGSAEDRRARYVCELVALGPKGEELRGRGTMEGSIAREPRGTEGFGYDPIVVPSGLDVTVAELGNTWKATHSHRAHAAQALRATVELPTEERRFALHPSDFLPAPKPPFERVEGSGVRYFVTPAWVSVGKHRLEPEGVASAIEAARSFARERGRTKIEWSLGPDATPEDLAERLLDAGLVRADEPPFARSAASLVLTSPPPPPPAGVDTRVVETLDDFRACDDVYAVGFGSSEEDRAAWDATLEQRWDAYQAADHVLQFVGSVDGAPVAAATALFSRVGVFLGGAATLPEARGRGAFRALVHARWEEAVRRGTPFLAVDAGPQSRPVLERLGFQRIGETEAFLDVL